MDDNAKNQETPSSQPGSCDVDRLLGDIANDYFDRIANGEHPSVDEYVDQHPEIGELIQQTFAAVSLLDHSHSRISHSHASNGGSPFGSSSASEKQHVIGDFRIVRELGRGGMGVVYEAEQSSMGGRRVALKVLPFAAIADPRQRQRFQNEVRAAASLDHPNIVSVYSVGEERGIHYYAMRLIDGSSMGELIHQLAEAHRESPLSADSVKQALSSPHPSVANGSTDPTEVLAAGRDGESIDVRDASQTDTEVQPQALVSTNASTKRSDYYEAVADLAIQAAEALDHAHQRGVVHRDIKPANLMIDAYSQLYVTDFGLAHIEEGVGMTMTGDLIGTLRYMSPEQALGKRVVIDYRTDIYSLGVSLYELLTTQPAFVGESRVELLKQISFEEPKRLSQVDRSIPRDLATIVHKAMEKNPDDRYASAQDLADDLRAYRAFQPIHAKPPTSIDRIRKFTRRNQGLVSAATLMLLLSTIGLAISNSMIAAEKNSAEEARDAEKRQRNEAEQQRAKAETERKESDRLRQLAEEAREDLRKNLYVADSRLSAFDLYNRNLSRLTSTLDKYLPGGDQADLRGWEWYYLLAGSYQFEKTLHGHTSEVSDAAWSPDGKWIATTSHDSTTRVWDANTGKLQRVFDLSGEYKLGLDWHPQSTKLAWGSTSAESGVRIWNKSTDQVHLLKGHEGSVWTVAWSPQGRLLASGSMDGTCKIWDSETLECIDTKQLDAGFVRDLVWHPTRDVLAFATDREIVVWNRKTGDLLREEVDPSLEQWRESVAYSPDGKHLLAGTHYGWLIQIDPSDLKNISKAFAHTKSISGIRWIDSERFLTSSEQGEIHLWSFPELQRERFFTGHEGGATSIDVAPSGLRFVSSSKDQTARVWRVEAPFTVEQIYGPDPLGTGFEVMKSGTALSYRRGTEGRINVLLGESDVVTEEQDLSIFDLREIPDDMDTRDVIATANHELGRDDGGMTFQDLLEDVTSSSSSKGLISWSPDQSLLARRFADGPNKSVFEVWDLASTSRLFRERLNIWFSFFEWSPNEKMLAVGHRVQAGLHMLDARAGKVLYEIPIGNQRVHASALCWNPSSSRFAAATAAGKVFLFDAATGDRLTSTQVSQAAISALAWSPDGTRIAVSSGDNTLRLLDATTLDEVLFLEAPNLCFQLEWVKNGRALVGRDPQGRLWIWDASHGYEYSDSDDFALNQLYKHAEKSIQSGEVALLIDEVERFLATDPDDIDLRKIRGRCYVARERWDEAAKDFRQIAQFDPNLVLNQHFCAVLGLAVGEHSEYRDACESMLNGLAPFQAVSVDWLACWTCSIGPNAVDDYALVAEIARKLVSERPDESTFRLNLGAILMRAEDYQAAKAELGKALQSASDALGKATASYFLAMTENELGNTDSAREHLKEAEEQSGNALARRQKWYRRLALELLRDEARELVGTDQDDR